MAMMNKTRDLIEGIVREASQKWALNREITSLEDEIEEMCRSPSGRRKWISHLSPIANVVVGRCSQILNVTMDELQSNFNSEASETIKSSSNYARNFLEYCCFRTLALYTQVSGPLSDKAFRRLTFDMMLAWEAPAALSQPTLKVGERTTGFEAFSRIAPAIPIIADVVTCTNLFDVLTSSSGGRLTFAIYEKYLGALDRVIKKMKSQSESSVLSDLRQRREERILEVDGTLTTQPVLEHIGTTTRPGRLILTDHALYFEALRVVTFDKPKVYELAVDLKQSIKPELTGPWGSRLFDKAVMYKSISLLEPVIMEFPELTGHFRRDYWLAIMREVLYAHKFIQKHAIGGVEKEETLSKAVLGVLRVQAIQELVSSAHVKYATLLMFNLCDQFPGGDVILETLASMICSRRLDRANQSSSGNGMYSLSALGILSNLGLGSQISMENKLLVGEIVVGEITSLERAVNDARINYKHLEKAQASINGVKVDGLDTKLAVMKELLQPMIKLQDFLISMARWDEPVKSTIFCSLSCLIIFREWLGYVLVLLLVFLAVFMLLTRISNQGKPIDELMVKAPPTMNTMEQILAVQNAISQLEELVQDANIFLLKLRALLLAVPTQSQAILTDAGQSEDRVPHEGGEEDSQSLTFSSDPIFSCAKNQKSLSSKEWFGSEAAGSVAESSKNLKDEDVVEEDEREFVPIVKEVAFRLKDELDAKSDEVAESEKENSKPAEESTISVDNAIVLTERSQVTEFAARVLEETSGDNTEKEMQLPSIDGVDHHDGDGHQIAVGDETSPATEVLEERNQVKEAATEVLEEISGVDGEKKSQLPDVDVSIKHEGNDRQVAVRDETLPATGC